MDINDRRADYLKQVIERLDTNPRAVSMKVGTNPTLVPDIINRKTISPTAKTWDKIAAALNVSVDELLNCEPQDNTIVPEVAELLRKLPPKAQVLIVPHIRGLLHQDQSDADK